ncbi:MAG: hypothetical protein L6R42_005306 [Xanthoria sp. 1 TBL-2021]|nr:MAG: hypothetical protein L6R42_005306 [Xanthoria sp. 1 TBL-2021]
MDSESHLLRLPLEIREQIWRLLLCRPGGLAVYEKCFTAEQMSGMMDMDSLGEIWGNEEGEGEEQDEEEEDEEEEDEEEQDEEGIGEEEGEEKEVDEEIWEDEEDGEQEAEEDQNPNSEAEEQWKSQGAAGNINSSSNTQGVNNLPRCCSTHWLPVAILRVNNQVYTECIEVLYRQNTFMFYCSAPTAEVFLAELPEIHRRAIRHIEFPRRTTDLEHDDTRQGWHRLPGFISKYMQVSTVTLWVPKDEKEALLFSFHWHSAWALVKLLLAGKITRSRIHIPAELEKVGILKYHRTKPFFDFGVDGHNPRISRVHMALEDIYAIDRICYPINENKYNEDLRKFWSDHRDLLQLPPSGAASERFTLVQRLESWKEKHRLKVAMKREDASSKDDKTVIVLTKPTL